MSKKETEVAGSILTTERRTQRIEHGVLPGEQVEPLLHLGECDDAGSCCSSSASAVNCSFQVDAFFSAETSSRRACRAG